MTAKECIARAGAESLTLGALSFKIESENGGSMENSFNRLSAMLSGTARPKTCAPPAG